MMMDEIPMEPNENEALNERQENEVPENDAIKPQNDEANTLNITDCIDIVLQVSFILLTIPWLISLIFFAIFDTKCSVFEQASVINCSQSFFIPNPRDWVLAWLSLSIPSSIILSIVIWRNRAKLNFQRDKAKKIYTKGSFWSLLFLLFTSSLYYIIRIFSTGSDEKSIAISVLVFLWPFSTVVVVCFLNYVPQVHWEKTRISCCTREWWKIVFNKNINFIIYWLALVIYFLEITCKLAAIMLDVANDVAPLIQSNFPEESGKFRSLMIIVIGFRLAFHARLLSFFWQKLFHGEKNLFNEPSAKLVTNEQQEAQVQDRRERPEIA